LGACATSHLSLIVSIYACIRAYIPLPHTHTHTHANAHARTRTHTHAHAQTHTHRHTRTRCRIRPAHASKHGPRPASACVSASAPCRVGYHGVGRPCRTGYLQAGGDSASSQRMRRRIEFEVVNDAQRLELVSACEHSSTAPLKNHYGLQNHSKSQLVPRSAKDGVGHAEPTVWCLSRAECGCEKGSSP
jgi:hypothetical protein